MNALRDVVANEEVERCDPTPEGRDFPTPRKVDISAPDGRIAQGDEYGEAYLEARDYNSFREGQIAASDKACQQKFDNYEKRKAEKAALLEETLKAAAEAAEAAEANGENWLTWNPW